MILAALSFYDFIVPGYLKALGRAFVSFYLWHIHYNIELKFNGRRALPAIKF